MRETNFHRLAGLAAFGAAAAGFLYSVSFVVISRAAGGYLNAALLMIGGLLSSVAVVALYERVRAAGQGPALWGLLLAMAGAGGAFVHGGYDLGNLLQPPTSPLPEAAHPVDPRGLLTFGGAGLGLAVLARLAWRQGALPPRLIVVGYLLAGLLVLTYLGRLLVFDPTSSLLLLPAALAGLVVNPVWYGWLGAIFWRSSS